jgi:hypothetical protein
MCRTCTCTIFSSIPTFSVPDSYHQLALHGQAHHRLKHKRIKGWIIYFIISTVLKLSRLIGHHPILRLPPLFELHRKVAKFKISRY